MGLVECARDQAGSQTAALHPAVSTSTLEQARSTPAPAPKAGVYRGADMATREHRQFRESIVEWIERTGMEILTTDCPFEGSPCAGTRQGFAQTAEHRGLADSQQAQAQNHQPTHHHQWGQSRYHQPNHHQG